MPTKNVIYVKLYWKRILHDNDRFVEQLNDEEKGLFLMLLLLAGATSNNIRYDENYLKRTLNLRNKAENVRKNMDKIVKVFPKWVVKDGYLKLRNFNKIHNYLRTADGQPKARQRYAYNTIHNIRIQYIKAKDFRIEDFSKDDYGRTGKSINTLLFKAQGNEAVVSEGLRWISKQPYSWTLETLIKKWPEFMKHHNKPALLKEYGK